LEGKISKLPLDKGNKLKEGSWEAYQVCGWCVFFKPRGTKEENECVRENINFYVWKNVVHGKKMCVNKDHGRKLCVTNSCSGVHGRMSMNKILDSYLK
jgi:hypothetical protein